MPVNIYFFLFYGIYEHYFGGKKKIFQMISSHDKEFTIWDILIGHLYRLSNQ